MTTMIIMLLCVVSGVVKGAKPPPESECYLLVTYAWNFPSRTQTHRQLIRKPYEKKIPETMKGTGFDVTILPFLKNLSLSLFFSCRMARRGRLWLRALSFYGALLKLIAQFIIKIK